MGKEVYSFEDFLQNVADEYKEFVSQVQELLVTAGYIIKIEKKASGFFVSYADASTKKSMLNFLFRKTGLYIRLYATNCGQYADVLNELPDEIVKQITKAKDCDALAVPMADGAKCICNPRNPKQSMGYDFFINGVHYQKCRSACFYFHVDSASLPFLMKLIENENKCRMA